MSRRSALCALLVAALVCAALLLCGCTASSSSEPADESSGETQAATLVGTWGASAFSVTFDSDRSMSSEGEADQNWGDVGKALQNGEEYLLSTQDGDRVATIFSPSYDDVVLFYEVNGDALALSTSPRLTDYPHVTLTRR